MLYLLPPVLLEEALCQEVRGLLYQHCVTRGGQVTTHQVQTMRHTWVTSWQEGKGWRSGQLSFGRVPQCNGNSSFITSFP
jgi:hypothetical protein